MKPPRTYIWVYMALVAAVMSHSLPRPACAQSEALDEVPADNLKMVFLYNFAKFVDWPAKALGEPKSPVVIGILDDAVLDGVGSLLDGKTAKQRPVVVRHCETLEEMRHCHILFLNTDDELFVKRILVHFSEKPVLTVGQNKSFNRWGGIINFIERDGRIGLAVSVTAARTAGLTISAQLLEVAQVVDKGTD